MKNSVPTARILCTCLLALCSSGCISMIPRSYPEEQSRTDSDREILSARLTDTLTSSFPSNMRVMHRVIMTIAGRQFALDGHLTFEPDSSMKLLVLGPMGVLADLTATPEGAVNVRRHNPRFRKRWVEKFIARDLRVLFSAPTEGEVLRASILEDGTPFLERELPEQKQTCRYFFDPKGETWTGLAIYRRGHRQYHAECLQIKTFPGQKRAFPSVISVSAKRYQLNIRVVQLSALPPAAQEAASPVAP